MDVALETGRGIFEVLAHICGSPLEALRQFVENAADAVEQTGRGQGSILVRVVRGEGGSVSEVVVEDDGVGITPEKMAQVLRNIGDSEKVNLALRGEKGVGILSFALIAREVHLNSCPGTMAPSACLVMRKGDLKEGKGTVLAPCPRHRRQEQGATVHLMGILAESTTSFNWKLLKEFLGREFASDLRRNLYSLTLLDGPRRERLEPHRLRGLPLLTQNIPVGPSGHAAVELHMLPAEAPDAVVSLCGRAGVRICPVSGLEMFQQAPWQDRRLEGYVRCDGLKLTANKTSVVQDRTFWELVAAVHALEPKLKQEMARVSGEFYQRRLGRVMRRVDFMVDRFLRYLEEGGSLRLPAARGPRENGGSPHLPPTARPRTALPRMPARALHLALVGPGEGDSNLRSWSNGGEEVVRVNKEHLDFMEAGGDDPRCARYLFSLWLKEHLLTEYGSDARRVADELVGWLNKAEPLLNRSGWRG